MQADHSRTRTTYFVIRCDHEARLSRRLGAYEDIGESVRQEEASKSFLFYNKSELQCSEDVSVAPREIIRTEKKNLRVLRKQAYFWERLGSL